MTNNEKKADPEAVRQVMRMWTTGVTIVTSCYDGLRHGMTVSSFTSVTLAPPLVMISLQRSSRTHGLIVGSGVFGVTILEETQQEISDRFAGRTPDDEDRFAGLKTFTMATGSPFIAGALAYLDCEVERMIQLGEHTLFFGEVIALQTAPAGRPLAYHNREYRFLRPHEES